MMPYGKVFQGNVFQGNLGRTGYAQPIQEPSQGTPYGMPRPSDLPDARWKPAGQPPQWNMGDDIRRPPSNPVRPPMPPPPPPGRIMDGPGSGFTFPGNSGVNPFTTGRAQPVQEPSQGTPYGGPQWNMGDDVRRATDYRPAPSYGQSDTSWQPNPDDYRRSIAEEQRRAAAQEREADERRRNAQKNRQTYEVPGYGNRVIDPMVAQNEYDRIAREQRAAARGDKPRKTQLELDMEMRNQEHNRIVKQRSQVQSALPDLDQATQNAIRQRMNAYGETPEEAYQNGGFAARAAQQQQAQQRQDLLQQVAANPAGNWRMPPIFR